MVFYKETAIQSIIVVTVDSRNFQEFYSIPLSFSVLVGHVYISGWRQDQTGNSVQFAKHLLVKKKLFPCMVEEIQNRKIQEKKFHLDQLVRGQNLNKELVFQVMI